MFVFNGYFIVKGKQYLKKTCCKDDLLCVTICTCDNFNGREVLK